MIYMLLYTVYYKIYHFGRLMSVYGVVLNSREHGHPTGAGRMGFKTCWRASANSFRSDGLLDCPVARVTPRKVLRSANPSERG